RFPPDAAGVHEVRVDLRRRDVQRIEAVADERQIVESFPRFPARPDSLRETRAEEVVRHGSICRRKKRERIDERSAAWNTCITAGQREALVELPADGPRYDDRRGAGGRPHGAAVAQPGS